MTASSTDKDTKARQFFDHLWEQGDYWQLETSEFERAKYACQLKLISDRTYSAILEIGCGAGVFSRQLAPLGSRVLALDVSEKALARAQAEGPVPGIEFRQANVMDASFSAAEPWDLVVMSETIYYVGWLYPFYDVMWLASQLTAAISPGGRLLMANSYGGGLGALLEPWSIRTYRDLFANTGLQLATEEIFRGEKDGVSIDCLVSVFEKPA